MTSDYSSGDGSQNIIFNNSPATGSTINSTGRVGADGSVLFLEIGRLNTAGKTLNELRSEVQTF